MISTGFRNGLRYTTCVLALSGLGLSLGGVPAFAQTSLLSPSPMATTPAAAPAPVAPAPVAPSAPTVPAPAAPVAAAPRIDLPAAPAVPPAVVTMPSPASPPSSAAQASPPTIPGAAASPAPAAGAVPAVPAVAAKAKRKIAPPAPPRETALSNDPEPTLTPETFFATAKASERYAAIADAGGWPEIAGPVSPGSKGTAVSTLRLRLAIEGDLGSGHGAEPGTATAEHVRHQMGSRPHGRGQALPDPARPEGHRASLPAPP